MYRFTLIVIALLLSSVSAYAMTGKQKCKIVYASQSDNTALRFDLRDNYLSTHDKRSPKIFEEQTEFGGYFTNCTNNEYYCISGPIDLLLPKNIRLLHWGNESAHCNAKRVHPSRTTVYVVKCSSHYGNQVRTTRFHYSTYRGVTSFRFLSPSKGSIYSLRGACGLFAASECRQEDGSMR